MEDRPGVLIVGGYGVFGGRLARLLLARGQVRVIVAGRSLDSARAFCDAHGGEPLVFDRDGNVASVLEYARPFVVVDAAGPFQFYGADPYRLARTALSVGAHYLDLSDDASFAAGIAALDDTARKAQRSALSGASSVPAISSAAVTALAQDLQCIEKIETLILPGNRAPRGLSVMRAILAQVGRPLALWRGDAPRSVSGWSGLRRDVLELPDGTRLPPRWSSWIGSPDLQLFPPHFRARSVIFRAGLELSLLHLGLALLAWLPRLHLIRSLESWARALRWIAERLEGFGTDRGGMRVEVRGRNREGLGLRRTWTLIAEGGEGPYVPALPALCLVERLLRAEVAPGARACIAELTLAEIEQATHGLAIRCGRDQTTWSTLYERALGSAWTRLPPTVRDAHDLFDLRRFRGEARVSGGKGPLAWLLGRIMRFPPPVECTPVIVDMERRGGSERWTRQFGRHRFHSTLSVGDGDPIGQVREQFGPLRFRLQVPVDETGLQMPMIGATAFGFIPLPRWLTPVSQTREFVDAQGRFCFDVDISLLFVGRVVRYEGWLVPEPAR